jgi:hypothetical protein
MTLEMKTRADLAITIASRNCNFLILTRDANSKKLLHYCYNTTKTGNPAGFVIGIHGTRRTAPFKVFDPAQAVSALQPPRPKTKDKKMKLFVPSLDVFLTAKTNKEFEKLEGTEQDNAVDGLAAWPNCFLAHPNLFSQLHSQFQVEASAAGIGLINAIIATGKLMPL